MMNKAGHQTAIAVAVGLLAWWNDLGSFEVVVAILVAVFMVAVLQTGEQCLEKLKQINENLERP